MQVPRFWNNPPDAPGWQARLLSPLGAYYARATARRLTQAPKHMPNVPVICIGNINAGGTGKTPTAIALTQHLQSKGLRVAVVSRGYGGSVTGPHDVDAYDDKAETVGDEPLLLAAFAETVVSKDRAAGVRHAEALGVDVILLDDGFQNPDVRPSLSLVVVDAQVGFGNGRCIPAGPLREPVSVGLARADLLLSIGKPVAQARFSDQWGVLFPCPQLKGALTPLATGMPWSTGRYFAFAGIGRPEKFFATLEAEGATLVGREALSDHQPIKPALIQRLLSDAQRLGAQVVTTEKDAVRIPAAYRPRVLTLPVRLEVEDWAPFDAQFTALMDHS